CEADARSHGSRTALSNWSRLAFSFCGSSFPPQTARLARGALRKAGIGYKELVAKLKDHGIEETEASITGKLNRGTFPVSFWLACLAVLELGETTLEDL